MSVVAPISKVLPVGLCRYYATGFKYPSDARVPVCLASPLRDANLQECSGWGRCSCYDPEWHGFGEERLGW